MTGSGLPPESLKAFPVQVISIEGGVVLKRGRVEVKISGAEAAEAVQTLLDSLAGGATRDQLHRLFPAPERPAVDALLNYLLGKRILVAADAAAEPPGDAAGGEDPLSVFYWHFGASRPDVVTRLGRQRLLIVGVNSISLRLTTSLLDSGVENVEVLDYPLLRNVRFFDDGGRLVESKWPAGGPPPAAHDGGVARLDPEGFDCLIATSDFGGLTLLREWNEFCVRHRKMFMPVVLQDLIGYVGPFVAPGETACFECFCLRRDAHLSDPESRRAVEAAAAAGQGLTGYLPSMASILGDLAAVELLKFYGLGAPWWKVGEAVEVNLLASEMRARPVLKLPRCPVCSPLTLRASARVMKNVFG
jgi:bacteriocin biosynthesis cyclodehydratase domain-containing protein